MKPETIAALCDISASRLKSDGRAVLRAFRASGYMDCPNEVTEAAIEAHLRSHPELVEQWFLYSLDQRSTPSWYLEEPGSGKGSGPHWRVGYLDDRRTSEVTFADGFQACAYFVKRMAEQWAGSARSV